MKYILKLSLVLLVVITGCGRLNDYDENAQVIIHVGYNIDKMSHSGEFYQGVDYADNVKPPILRIPFYNGSGQQMTVTHYQIPEGWNIAGNYTVPTAEQGVLEIPVKGTCTAPVGLDTLIFFLATPTRTWEVYYPIEIEDPNGLSNAFQIVSAEFDAQAMREVYVASHEITGNKQISLNYINGNGRMILFRTYDPTDKGLFDVGIDKAVSFVANSEDENNIILPLTASSRYKSDKEFVDLEVIADEYNLSGDSILSTTSFVIYDIPTTQPATLDYTPAFAFVGVTNDDNNPYLETGMILDNTIYIDVTYKNGQNREVTITGVVRDGSSGTGVGVVETKAVLNEETGTVRVPLTGTLGSTYSTELSIDIYINGWAISDNFASTPESCTETIYKPAVN